MSKSIGFLKKTHKIHPNDIQKSSGSPVTYFRQQSAQISLANKSLTEIKSFESHEKT
jgi:hypothetical protein